MKTFLLTITTLLTLSATAGVITCSNNPNSPGQYTDLQDAIDNANANDTILVHGSSTAYVGASSYNIEKPLVLIGAGYNNPNGENTTITSAIVLKKITNGLSASGTKIIGMQINYVMWESYFSGGNASNQGLDDVIIERCYVWGELRIGDGSPGNTTNVIVRNCLFKTSNGINFASGGNAGHTFSNISIHNCIFSNNPVATVIPPKITYNNGVDCSGIVFSNNLFISNYMAASYPLFIASYSVPGMPGPAFENNVFYKMAPIDCINCTFNNNISYLCTNDTLIHSNNPGSTGGGNIYGQNPNFVSFPLSGDEFLYSHDFNLQPSSPAIATGIAGVDMGVFGGVLPYDIGANPSMPQMESINTPLGTAVSKGTNLNVTFKSYKQD